MKQAKNRFGGWAYYIVLLVAILTLGTFLAGCSTSEEMPGDSGEAIAEVVLEPTAAPATPTNEPEPTDEVVEPPAEPDRCLDCHTNKDRLINTADPEEEVISENEGKG